MNDTTAIRYILSVGRSKWGPSLSAYRKLVGVSTQGSDSSLFPTAVSGFIMWFFGVVANPPTRHTQSPTDRVSVLYVCVMSVPQATTAHGPIYPTCHSTSVSHTHTHRNSAWSIWVDTWKVDFCTALSNINRLKMGCVCVFGGASELWWISSIS